MKEFQDGDPFFGVMANAIAQLWPNGTAVMSGCTQTGSGAARQVTVATGQVMVNGTTKSVSQQMKTLDAAAFDRYDLISVNSVGTVVVTKGTETRKVPTLPTNSVPIAVCLIETEQTTLPADRIYDARLLASHAVARQLTLVAGLVSSGKTVINASGYVPSSQLEIVGEVDMQSNPLTGLPAPSAATNAATKGYVDTATANRAMGGFKITGLGTPTTIDDASTKAYADTQDTADRTYADTQIAAHNAVSTGVHGLISSTDLEATVRYQGEYSALADDTLSYEFPIAERTSTSYVRIGYFTLKSLYPHPTTVRVYHELRNKDGIGTSYSQIWKNGQPYGEEHTELEFVWTPHFENLVFDQDDTVELWCKTSEAAHAVLVQTFRICGVARTFWPHVFASGIGALEYSD